MDAEVKTRFTSQPRMRTAVLLSAILHALLLAAISFSPDISLPFLKEKPMKIDMVWVELPKGSSDEIGLGIKAAEGLPQSTIEEQKQAFQPEPVEQQTLKPELRVPPPTPPEAKTAEVKPQLRPEISVSARMIRQVPGAKAVPRKSATDRKIQDALAKIDKSLAGRQVVPESGQVSKNMDGYKYGTSDKPLRVSPSDPEYLKYQALVRAKIIRSWVVPTTINAATGTRFSAQIEVVINMDGEVVSTRWSKGSGSSSFDQSALRAVRNASPFPRPPERMAWEAYNEGFLVEFDARMKP